MRIVLPRREARVSLDQEDSTPYDGAGRGAQDLLPGHLGEGVQEMGRDQVELAGREGRAEVVALPVDTVGDVLVGGVTRGAFEGDAGDVDRRDAPALLGEPDRVSSLAAAEVKGAARRQAGDLTDERVVGPPAPDPVALPVALVPLLTHAHRDSSTARRASSAIRAPFIAAPARTPAAAEPMTCSIREATFPATHTPGISVAPVGSAAT